MADNEKIYVGKAVRKPSKYGEWLKVEIDLTQIKEDASDFIREYTDKSGKTHKVITLNVSELPEKHQDDRKTHSVRVDTWKPDPAKRKGSDEATRRVQDTFAPAESDEEVPF